MGQPMQMHPGMSGAPHVSQPGAMVGMQPGAQMGPGGQHHPGMMQHVGGQSMPGGMPNAQAMSHLTPQQMMQQQMHQSKYHLHRVECVFPPGGSLASPAYSLVQRHVDTPQKVT